MKLRKVTAILLCVLLVISMLPTVTAVGTNGYYNKDFLEAEAAAAYQEQGLGAVYTPQATTWKVWSPTAAHVQLRLYNTGSDDEPDAAALGTYSMTQNASTGVWSLTLEGDYNNVYYTYLVTVRGVTRETRDIYAKAAGVNGDRSMVVDLDATDPDGWENDQHVLLDESTDAVIWEVHVRDFSISPSSGVSADNRGKYLAFTEDNTTLNGSAGEVSTCVNYLKEMGVNTVHLLPVYDYGSVDETNPQTWIDTTMEEALSEGYVNGVLNPNYYKPERNWGYDPNNYNVPEGSYSSNPYDGSVRINEFKQMVQALHEAGISVVMDVVYNHTYDLDDLMWGYVLHNNAFNDTVPGYYFRLNSPLEWINGSGCGNVTASDKLMYRKYMVESVHYWATEYHIDGFRFDLMACHDVTTMNAIRSDLDSLYNGEGRKILMYGEPWDGSFGGGTGISDGANVDNAVLGLNERIAMFCSWLRDAIKGGTDDATWGWIQGDTTQAAAVLGGLTANDGRLSAPSQTVTYADAHDNLILWDKIVKSNNSSDYTNYTSSAAQTYLKQLNLAKTIVLMSQGLAFNVAGTEFARTKLGCHNSYKGGDNINAIDWTARKTNAASADYYKGLIQIRAAFSPITDPNNQHAKYNLEGSGNSCIAVRIPNSTAGEWKNLILILNDDASSATVTLPEGSWNLIANGEVAGLTTLSTCSGTYTVPAYGSAILVNDTAMEEPEPETNEDLYLVGWINGADYGCEADAANTGIYKFVNGSLTATFTQDSYVYVKTGDNRSWYMTDGWLGTSVTSATLYNTNVLGNNGNKLYVPGGVEVIFTLTEGANDTYTLSYVLNGELPGPDQNFYLNGWINGGNYTGNDYVFHEGTLTTQFTADSYVIIRWGGTEYWTEGWQGTNVSGAFLYPKADCAVPDKLYVPGNVPVTFTVTVLSDGTLNLTYTTGGTKNLRGASDYYLFGYINGENYGDQDDYATIGDYQFVNGSLTTSFSVDSYVGVKTGDNANWFMTDGWEGNATSVTLYNTGVYDLGTEANKLLVPGGVEITFSLVDNGDNTLTLSYTTGDPVVPPPSGDAKNAVILHCWNWSYDTILQNLDDIKAAGYTAVQTSPAQPHSGYQAGTIGTGDWWMLYQPLGFHIAQANQSWLGDANDLEDLCTAAHAKGIEVIVDVVANHLCNAYNDIALTVDPRDSSQIVYNSGGHVGYRFEILPDARVQQFNPELTNDKFRSNYVFCNDTNTEAVVHGNIGMPDLKTEDTTVQTSVLNYLKELIDVGVDGFRFDAAKHIETPSDGNYASQFWPNIMNGAEAYAETKNKSVWGYGEVLSTAGHDRKMNYYAPYIDMTEISYAYTITEGFGKTHSATQVANQLFKDWLGVGTETLANSDLVLMAESHDMYAQSSGSFSEYGPEIINKAWAVAVARADASALYFARPQGYQYGLNPDDPSAGYPVGTLGACEDLNWKDIEVAEANKFHNEFVGASEAVYAANNLVVVERYDANHCGAIIVNATGTSGSVSFASQHLADGSYFDQITGNEFTVSNGTVSGQMGYTGIVVLVGEQPNVCAHEHTHNVTKEPTCTEPGCVQVICDDCGQIVSSTETDPALGHIDVNEDNRCDRCGLYLGVKTVYFVDALDWVPEKDHFTNVNVYAFGDGGENAPWPGEAMELVGRTLDNHGIWKVELNPEAYQTVKMVGLPGEEDEVKTVNLSYVSDMETLESDFIVYTSTSDVEASAYGSEYVCTSSDDLESICAHTAYTIVTVNGGETWICDCCGAVIESTEPNEPIFDANLQLFVSLVTEMEIYTTFGAINSTVSNYDSWYIEVSKLDDDGNPTETKRFGPNEENPVTDGYVRTAYYTDITAKEMGVSFAATLHAFDADGQEYYGETKTSTVRDTLISLLTNTSRPAVRRTLAANMLNYGAAAQLKFEFKTDDLVNENLPTQAAADLDRFESKGLAPADYNNGSNGPNVFGAVQIMNRVVLGLTVTGLGAGSDSVVQVQVKNHETGVVRAVLDTVQRAQGVYVASFSDAEAEEMRTPFDIVALVDGVETGTPLTWSVEGYVKASRQNPNYSETDLNLLNALLHYVDSVVAVSNS